MEFELVMNLWMEGCIKKLLFLFSFISRDWKENDNTISLDEEVVIDVPPFLSSLSTYCSTLAHKANHFNEQLGIISDFFSIP